ncbi:MAG: cell wall-binding repeat-containing protein, partial [Clostridia bacterium]|nr:cell wall-binding repeat-containing protein [Clostridia bacterium]
DNADSVEDVEKAIDEAQDAFDDAVAEDFVNEHASDDNASNPYDKANDPVDADNADRVLSGADEYNGYSDAVKEKINNLIKTKSEDSDSPYADYDEMLDAAELATAKDAANKKIDDAAKKAKDKIDKLDNLTDKEKSDLKKKIDNIAKQGKKDVNKSTTVDNVKTNRDNTINKINSVVNDAKNSRNRVFKVEKSNYLRVYGDNRYSTALSIAKAYKEEKNISKFNVIIIANGTGTGKLVNGKIDGCFPDALSGGYLATITGAPVLTISESDKSTQNEVLKYVKANLKKGGTVYVLGGNTVMPVSFVNSVKNLGVASTVKRLGGQTRYETNMTILKEALTKWNAKPTELIIASGKNFPDALSASATGRPVLIVDSNITSAQKKFIKSNVLKNVNKIYVAGGTAAVPTAVDKDIKNVFGKNVTKRFAGNNRYETSVAIANYFFGKAPNTVVLAAGSNYPDALSGVSIAYALSAPIVLVADGNDAASKYLTNIKYAMVLGGTVAVPTNTARTSINQKKATFKDFKY